MQQYIGTWECDSENDLFDSECARWKDRGKPWEKICKHFSVYVTVLQETLNICFAVQTCTFYAIVLNE